MTEHLLPGLALIFILAIGAQWLAWRIRLPSILLLLTAGFVAGPVLGWVHPDALLGRLLFPIVSLSVGVILFEGGLTLRFSELPRVSGVILRLISVGALITWLIAGAAAYFVLQLDLTLSVLLGAILIVTGPTVIGPLLRQIRPKGHAGTVVKWEGILIDPVGASLAVLIFEAILGGEFGQATSAVAGGVLQTALVGTILGLVGAGVLIVLLKQFWVPDYLENGMSLLILVAAFTLSDMLRPEAGLLTATVMGIALANQRTVPIKHIVEFKENLQVLLVGTLFILLAARMQWSDLAGLGVETIAFVAILILVARPLSVFFSTWRSPLDWRERLFVTWMAPRGIVAAAVSSVFSFELAEAGVAGADQLVSVTFLVIVGTVIFYGLSAGPIARRLQLAEQDPQGVLIVGAHGLAREMASTLQGEGFRVVLIDTNMENVRAARMEELEAHYGNAISEDVFEELDLTGIGRLLALTSNNEVNSLAALHFPELFSRAEVYQLPAIETGRGAERQAAPAHLRGRFLFGEEMTYHYLIKQCEDGATVKATPLTALFDYVDLQTLYDNEAIPLFLVTERNKLVVYTTDYQPIPRPGQTLISLVKPVDE